MNAYELADELERLYQQDCIDGVADLSMPEAANMLCQQADEIVQLKLEWQVWYDQNLALRERIAYLESQIYGGFTQ